jgi:hypothetical protein
LDNYKTKIPIMKQTDRIEDVALIPAHTFEGRDVEWNLLNSLKLIRELWPIAERCGYYIGLTGSVMIRGWSLKDLDIIVYPWKVEGERMSPEDLLQELGCEKFFECGKMPKDLEGEVDEPPSGGSDQKSRVKSVYWSKRENKRIDWFMLK